MKGTLAHARCGEGAAAFWRGRTLGRADGSVLEGVESEAGSINMHVGNF